MKQSLIVFLLLLGVQQGEVIDKNGRESTVETYHSAENSTIQHFLRGAEVVEERATRRLSATTDPVSGQTIRTYNGIVPIESCPIGYWRPLGSTSRNMITGPRIDGCVACPRGTYGQTTTGTPCVLCPIGTYGDEVGLTSIRECQFCPQGRYGIRSGLTTKSCTGRCPVGKYSDITGMTTPTTQCMTCEVTSQNWQCRSSVDPRSAKDPPVVKTNAF